MLIRPSTTFAHPILSPHTEDYGDRTFDITIDVGEAPDAGAVELKGACTLDDEAVRQLVTTQHATLGVVVECLETYFQRFFPVGLEAFSLDFPYGELRGRVAVQAVLAASEDNVPLESDSIPEDYPPHTRVVRRGDVIAVSTIHTFEAGLDKFLPMESIFHLVSSENVGEGIFLVELDNEAIRIEVNPKLYTMIYGIRGTSMRDILLPSLFLPAVMTALDAMRNSGYEAHRWHRVIEARCSNEGIVIDSGTDLAFAAQKLLDAPLGLLQGMFKEGEQ
ncbi:hypothetical protein [Luteimonas sp. MC1750]|uniref:hypothetical protein n=1 Tax=Luteimonas sp. MC1750 TaxID=2799326 RepID=UPI0018F09E96|nr:hypothetical protein [Luteimonas sp. MC1750]MBJ6984336.1 hypothetical protein [Luteimonas sp. MC1750]QQO05042.1 hypothetical protein JGR68_09145 [Luteimonas sp. MC1750]